MILRRLVERIRSENWAAVAIELLIVVLGVFLGLKAQEWSVARQTEAEAAEYTRRLTEDFRSELWVRSFLFEYYSDVRDNNERLLDAIEGRLDLGDEAQLIAAFRATQYIQWYASPSTYGELVSIGSVDMIRDPAQRDLARQTFAASLMDNIEREGGEAPFRRAFRSVVALDVQRALRNPCGDRVPTPGDFSHLEDPLDYPCESGLTPEQIEAALAAVRDIDGLAPMLRLRVTELSTRLNALGFSVRRLREGLGVR